MTDFWIVKFDYNEHLLLMNSFLRNYLINGVFPKWNRMSLNSGNLINHSSVNGAQFKDPISHMCLAGTVVASWSLTHGVAVWQV